MNHPGGDCNYGENGPFRSEILRKVIVRLRPHDIPRMPASDSKEFTLYYALVTIFSIISLNILGAMTLMACYLTLLNWNEMKVSASFEVLYASTGLISVFLIKICQCFVSFYAGMEKRKEQNRLTAVNNFMYVPCILILWLGLSCTQVYQNKVLSLMSLKHGPDDKNSFVWRHLAFKHPPFETLQSYMVDESMEKAWDSVQMKFRCCGSYGLQDYIDLNMRPPKSCYTSSKPKSCERGCLPIVNVILYDLASQIHSVILWLLIPIEGLLAMFTILAFFTKMNQIHQNILEVNGSGSGGDNSDTVNVYATYDVPVTSIPRT
ncbi:unnamed protein product [Hermetia illucens]|uniref:Tetraspanin n=2 Tax=Hermetia illucens TaxID=343691 RepID=A0A7R8UIL5_HERIL|nr:unnamed protein product [Hermetia illucens]